MRILRLIPFLLLLVASACSPADLTNTASPLPPPATPALALTDTPTLYRTIPSGTPVPVQKAVRVSLFEASSASYGAQVDFGNSGQMRLSLEPVLLQVTLNPDGSLNSTSTQIWPDAALKEMEVCFSFEQPCPLSGQDWKPFQAESRMDYTVDWLGARQVFAGVRVKDANGQTIPVYLEYAAVPQPQVVASYYLTGQANLQTPDENQPGPVRTALALTQTAFPVTGSVLIEDGVCCKGGIAGTSVTLSVAFSASSSAGRVTEMRVSNRMGCSKGATELDAPWEPFAPARTYSALLAINWVGWYANVQYRDDQGYLSPVYCDDISLEGSPSPPP